MVDCSQKSVTIFGGGEVGARKARYFADEADVTVYSRSFSPGFESINVKKTCITIPKDEQKIRNLIQGAFLVITATSDPDLNRFIATISNAERILCNSATEPAADVTLPAKYTGNTFTLSISTNGGSPAVARFIREHFEKTWPHLDLMITLEERLKHNLKEQQIPESQRREILTSILYDDTIWQALQQGLEPAVTLAKEKYLP